MLHMVQMNVTYRPWSHGQSMAASLSIWMVLVLVDVASGTCFIWLFFPDANCSSTFRAATSMPWGLPCDQALMYVVSLHRCVSLHRGRQKQTISVSLLTWKPYGVAVHAWWHFTHSSLNMPQLKELVGFTFTGEFYHAFACLLKSCRVQLHQLPLKYFEG